ncbi:cobalt-precorrin-5B (C(1))-methyltransferase [Falsihalocynthiibacter sp. S25ZX9]|uniref:cobalt-precorrin-5B (C(1))-methyltransferase n=1 Tax=Falsihalocynthiibacter sp. S25ZX9 TaxID=3240870 RepID=UPI00350FF94A
MTLEPKELRRGWTTGACATAATKAALVHLWGGAFEEEVSITLPRGETPDFTLAETAFGTDWAEAAIIKDAGDDPDVTHGAMIRSRVTLGGHGIRFKAGAGVGTVTKPGLPIGVGEPAINPVPRQMMQDIVAEMAAKYGADPQVEIEISIDNGLEIAKKTWNPRLGIVGGLSVLGTTGVVRPFSCSAWIASIHRGIDVARATGLTHVAGCTGATSEKVVQGLYDLPLEAMLDMGDFAGGLLKYLRKHPVERVTIGGGIGKMVKLAQGAVDLHSGRSQVDFSRLAELCDDASICNMNTALQAYEKIGKPLANNVAREALLQIRKQLRDTPIQVDVVIIDRVGLVIGRAQE